MVQQQKRQRTARFIQAYGPAHRSSRVTPDVVYRLGRVPVPRDIKTTIGTMPRRSKRRRSQRGGALDIEDITVADLRRVAGIAGDRVTAPAEAKKRVAWVAAFKAAGISFEEAQELARADGAELSILKSAREREAKGEKPAVLGPPTPGTEQAIAGLRDVEPVNPAPKPQAAQAVEHTLLAAKGVFSGRNG